MEPVFIPLAPETEDNGKDSREGVRTLPVPAPAVTVTAPTGAVVTDCAIDDEPRVRMAAAITAEAAWRARRGREGV
jgi:hypothetical protein